MTAIENKWYVSPYARDPQQAENYYGRVVWLNEDGTTTPIICGHGGSMWFCRECAELTLSQEDGPQMDTADQTADK